LEKSRFGFDTTFSGQLAADDGLHTENRMSTGSLERCPTCSELTKPALLLRSENRHQFSANVDGFAPCDSTTKEFDFFEAVIARYKRV
jgi:hypothetical protein